MSLALVACAGVCHGQPNGDGDGVPVPARPATATVRSSGVGFLRALDGRSTLRQGAQGDEVRALQRLLNKAGFDVDEDGVFGPDTARALKEFQRRNGLSPDAIAGPKTWAALEGQNGATTPPTTPAPCPSGNCGGGGNGGGGNPGGNTGVANQPLGEEPGNGGENNPVADGPSPGVANGQTFTARGTGYYPENSALQGGFNDRLGNRLYTLQQYLAGNAPYVSTAMDATAFPYGQKIRILELEKKYGRVIDFRVVDTGGAFKGKGRTRIDICTANKAASRDATINGQLRIVVVK